MSAASPESPPEKETPPRLKGGAESQDTKTSQDRSMGHSVSDCKGIRSRSPEPPFCWQSKIVRRRIRDAFDSSSNVLSALGVYDALTEIASDFNSERFQVSRAHIAAVSGASVTTVK